MEQWLFAIFGAALALLGSLVQSTMSWTQTRSSRRTELLLDAYKTYLDGIAKRVSILHDHSERTEQATELLVAGKQKICAYAPTRVVKALANFERTPLLLSEPTSQSAMTALVIEMRKSVGVASNDLERDIGLILFSAHSEN